MRRSLDSLLQRLSACGDARSWVREREAQGDSWEAIFAAACEQPFFDERGADWLEWLVVRLTQFEALSPRDVWRAEVRVWQALDLLHPHFEPGVLAELRAWDASEGLDASQLSQSLLPVLPFERDDRADNAVRSNVRDLHRAAGADVLNRFTGTWDVLVYAIGCAAPTPRDADTSVGRLADAIHDHHTPLLIAALEALAEDEED